MDFQKISKMIESSKFEDMLEKECEKVGSGLGMFASKAADAIRDELGDNYVEVDPGDIADRAIEDSGHDMSGSDKSRAMKDLKKAVENVCKKLKMDKSGGTYYMEEQTQLSYPEMVAEGMKKTIFQAK